LSAANAGFDYNVGVCGYTTLMPGASAAAACRLVGACPGSPRAAAAAVARGSSGRLFVARRRGGSWGAWAPSACRACFAERGGVVVLVLRATRRGFDPRRRSRCCRLALER
jgi:hypothetical protein